MPVKHSFNQTNIALMSVEKLTIFELRWVVYMSKNLFCFIKTCAFKHKISWYSVEILTFSPAVSTRCKSNMASINRSLRSDQYKNI